MKIRLTPNRAGRLPSHTVLRCFFTGHQVGFCRGLCRPYQGRGACGRLAAHAMKSRTQRAIEAYMARNG